MDLKKRIQLEKIYRKRRVIIKGFIALFPLMGISHFFSKYIPEIIYSNLNYIFLTIFFILQYLLISLLQKVSPILHNNPSFTGGEDFAILYKSIATGSSFTFIFTGILGLLSESLFNLTIKSVCGIVMGGLILSSLVAFLVFDKKERKKAKIEIENSSKK